MIYFVQRTDGDIKIGTTFNFPKRLSSLVGVHGELKVLGVMDGGTDEERQLHSRFQTYRRGKRELFEPAPEIWAFIARHSHEWARDASIEQHNIGLKPKTYAWFAAFRRELELQLERKVTFSEAASITANLAANGVSGETLAQTVARGMKERSGS